MSSAHALAKISFQDESLTLIGDGIPEDLTHAQINQFLVDFTENLQSFIMYDFIIKNMLLNRKVSSLCLEHELYIIKKKNNQFDFFFVKI